MPVDAVFLSMHGAMVAEGYDDCESDMLAHVRKVVGPDVPVGVELDLHCNIGEGTLRDATALVLFKEYPHVDVSERADDLFTVMEGAIEGRTKPVMATWDCSMIGVFHTTRQPMRGFVDKLQVDGRQGRRAVAVDRPRLPVVRHQGDEQPHHRHHRRRQGQGREAGARARPGVLRHARGHPAALRLARRGDGARLLAQPAQADGAGRRVGQCRRRGRVGFDLHPEGPARQEGEGRRHRHVLGSGRGEARLRGRRRRRTRHPARRQARAAVRPADRRARQGAEAREGRHHRVRRQAQGRRTRSAMPRRCRSRA